MRLLFRVLGVAVACSAIAAACGGSDFSSDGHQVSGGTAGLGATGGKGGSSTGGTAGDTSPAGTAGGLEGGAPSTGGTGGTSGGTGGTAGTAGSAGTAGGGTTLCKDAKDCDDGKPCTVDSCGADGVCVNNPKCAADQLCCDGVCGECCQQSDCNDQVACTDDVCFAGICNHTDSCTDKTTYCSPTGCVPRENCQVDADCADDDPCTVDSCKSGLCDRQKCPNGGSCCAGLGCGTCCGDSQCGQTDPCMPSTCGTDLACHVASLCEGVGKCCPSADGTTAACGECCDKTDCPDDGVACTIEKCTDTGNGTLGCVSEPDPSLCPMGQTCDPTQGGCSANNCKEPGDCAAPGACQQVQCSNGTCNYGSIGCSHSQDCCTYSGKCQDCCETKDCRDSSAPLCCKETGTCAQCCQDSDCVIGSTGSGGATPQALVGGAIISGCSRPFCNMGVCAIEAGKCAVGQKCCDTQGCVPLVQGCGVMTN